MLHEPLRLGLLLTKIRAHAGIFALSPVKISDPAAGLYVTASHGAISRGPWTPAGFRSVRRSHASSIGPGDIVPIT